MSGEQGIGTNTPTDAFGPEDIIQAGSAAAAPDPAPPAPPAPAAPAAAPAQPKKPEPDPSISDADRVAYMRHILGSLRFTKEYTLAKGAVRIKLRSRTVAENDELYGVLAQEIRDGKLTSNLAGMEYVIRMFRMFLAASCVSCRIESVDYVPEGKTIAERHAWFSRTFNETQYRILIRAQEEFEHLMGALYSEALDADFTADRVSAS